MDLQSLLIHINIALSVLYGPQTPEQKELWCLTENVLYESAGEAIEGQLAVIEVVNTRRDHRKYPNTYCKVIHEYKQFSWTLVEPEFRRKPTNKEIELAVQLAYSYMQGKLPKTSVHGATHFINPDAADYIPEWYHTYEYLGKLGDHEFFRRPSSGERASIKKRKCKCKYHPNKPEKQL